MAVLVAFGTMDLAWMAGLTVVIFVEKVLPRATASRRRSARLAIVLGLALLINPTLTTTLT